MADRLSELARQRALLSEHLAWLDREIADETVKRLIPNRPADQPGGGSTSVTPVTPPRSPESASVHSTTPAAAAASATASAPVAPDATEILEQYRVTPTSVKQDVRKGCLLYFAAAFLILGLVVAILYFAIGTRAVE